MSTFSDAVKSALSVDISEEERAQQINALTECELLRRLAQPEIDPAVYWVIRNHEGGYLGGDMVRSAGQCSSWLHPYQYTEKQRAADVIATYGLTNVKIVKVTKKGK